MLPRRGARACGPRNVGLGIAATWVETSESWNTGHVSSYLGSGTNGTRAGTGHTLGAWADLRQSCKAGPINHRASKSPSWLLLLGAGEKCRHHFESSVTTMLVCCGSDFGPVTSRVLLAMWGL